ncbi:MAG: D-alanyl-D-alanine carboxypeptidase [Phycisphaerales bacterium]|nr:MAG: D-alanyl-D-alanine carboxypeptidase [Phycisphaerales bacterium]
MDGSLKKRLKDMPGKVRGKTGTMRSIRTLSGYADRNGGGRYAFAIMFNGYKGPSTPYKEIQDRICRMLVRGGQ